METITERCGFHIERISVKHCGNYEKSYEIAYVGTTKPSAFRPFAASLVAVLFRERDGVTAECDDVDSAAMTLKSLFRPVEETPYDTYILD